MEADENKGKVLIMDMGVKGAKELKKRYYNIISIYIIPPNITKLVSQMENRNMSRLKRNKKQIEEAVETCDWLIINDDLDIAVSEIERIIKNIKKYRRQFT